MAQLLRVTTVAILAICSDARKMHGAKKPPVLFSELGPALASKRVQFPAGIAPAPRRGACSPFGEHMKTALRDNHRIDTKAGEIHMMTMMGAVLLLMHFNKLLHVCNSPFIAIAWAILFMISCFSADVCLATASKLADRLTKSGCDAIIKIRKSVTASANASHGSEN